MARYLVETAIGTADERRHGLTRAAVRYPEVTVERRYEAHDGDGPEIWLCRAPSPSQLASWAGAAGLAIGAIRQVDVTEGLGPDTRSG